MTTLAERARYAHLWLPGLLASRGRRLFERKPRHLWLTLADHFEPLWRRADEATARGRVATWRSRLPEIAERHRDAGGQRPVYSFFFPEEQYRPDLVEPLAEMTRSGIADVEVHIHHDREGEEWFVQRMSTFLDALHSRHGLLRRQNQRLAFGFIHGNWALDNSHPSGRWCGLDNEITLLRDLGCYADFTLPAPASPCQAGPVNVIYRVTDEPQRPRSHARGVRVRPGLGAVGDLTLIPGPVGVGFRGGRPRTEWGELSGRNPVSAARVRMWLSHAPRIGEHVFLKLFAHGAQEEDAEWLLGGGLDQLFTQVAAEASAQGVALRFVSAWDMWRAVEALRRGEQPSPGRTARKR
jgi:hypothetical protein